MTTIDYTGGYYEAKIQLRPFNREIYDYIIKEIEKRKNVFIAKKIEKKYGIDIYITSNSFAMALGKKLKHKFKGELKISRALFCTDRLTSKLLYRITILFRTKEESL
ncbi:MAG: hypothetical protein KJ623_02030 [Nanoarchaeota archaeon]|nr:hypothetical protein [Nanoarchaeota archaeon]MBU0962788.1 hypothetical protein [Nanoarchaeota archaeon]